MINICTYISITAFSLLIWICLASFSGYLVSVILESLLFSTQMLKNCDQIWLYHLSCARRVRLIQYFIIRHFLTSVVIFPTVLWTLSNLSLGFFFQAVEGGARQTILESRALMKNRWQKHPPSSLTQDSDRFSLRLWCLLLMAFYSWPFRWLSAWYICSLCFLDQHSYLYSYI